MPVLAYLYIDRGTWFDHNIKPWFPLGSTVAIYTVFTELKKDLALKSDFCRECRIEIIHVSMKIDASD